MSTTRTVQNEWTKAEIDTARTFDLQDRLPPLPLPTLDQTRTRYLKAVRALVTPEEFLKTKSIVDYYFASPDALAAQKQLIKRAASRKNWLEEWWNSFAYLKYREPLYPLLNFGGCSPHFKEFGPKSGSQLERAALIGWLGAQYWLGLYQQKIPVMRTNKPVPLCMEQFRSIFCTARIPLPVEDRIECYFRTEDDEAKGLGTCPKHLVIICNGHYWKLDIYDPLKHQVVSFEDFYAGIKEIAERSKEMKPAIGSLTCLNRDDWAKEKKRLCDSSLRNLASFAAIDQSIFALSLTTAEPTTETELNRLSVVGSPDWQYADKAMLWHIHNNGLVSSSCDHSPNEGIVMVAVSNFIDIQLEKLGYNPPQPPPEVTPEPKIEELSFDLDKTATRAISKAHKLAKGYTDDLQIDILQYEQYSRDYCKQLGYNIDTVTQIAVQAAYFKSHGKPAPTYETASTKQFFHGRTETMKSCTSELVDFVKDLADPASHPGVLLAKFKSAVKAHDSQMRECQNGIGVDRHLLGLRVQSGLLGLSDPPIFSDPAYIKQGGDGNYILSTSYLGGTNTYGGVVPMVRHGYGVFYRATDEQLSIFFSAWKSATETDLDLFKDNVIWALGEIRKLLELPMAKL